MKENNIKVGNLKHKVPEGYTPIYIGRSGKGMKGLYGNPFGTKVYNTTFKTKTVKEAVSKFRELINSDLRSPEFDKLKERFENDEKLFLQCFCKKKIDDGIQCHGDEIRKWILEKSDG